MNDPRVTQYALGELTGSDRAEFERDLAVSENLQNELNETIQLTEKLGPLLMSTETLPAEQREALRKQCAENLRITRRNAKIVRVLIYGGVTAAAACVLFSLSMPAVTGALTRARPMTDADFASRRSVQLAAQRNSISTGSVAEEVGADQLRYALSQTDSAVPVAIPAATPSSPSTIIAQLNEPAQVDNGRFASTPDTEAQKQRSQIDSTTMAAAEAASIPVTLAVAPNLRASAPGETRAFGNTYASGSGAGGKALGAKGDRVDRGAAALGDFRRAEDKDLAKNNAISDEFNTEAYAAIQENVFLEAKDNPLSTFSIDVDTASYSNLRRFLQNDQRPPAGAIRTEELINYFTYNYPQPKGDAPFSVNLEVSRAPWDAQRELVRIGLKGKEIPASERGAANLVFLLDVSGSMNEPDKLPLLKRSLHALVENLSPKDRVAIVVYAGSSGLVLPSTPGTKKATILEALDNLTADGSTNGAAGIQLAYQIARENFLKEGNNRVILCTDGDFNVGTTNESELVKLIEEERASGVFLSVLGFGTGNLKDSTMEKLADKGNGNYGYIDSFTEGRKVLVEQMGSTLFTIAKDVKIQVEFNPARVAGYRLIGYENRLLAKEDFNDDKKDAGEIGAGHSVTALYEIIPAGQSLPDHPSVDPLKYQKPSASTPVTREGTDSTDLLTVKLRYKAPDGDKSKLIEVPLSAPAEIPAFEKATSDFQFASAVAAFGMKLRGSPTAGDIGWSDIQKIVRRSLGEDPGSYRAEFLTLVEKASKMDASKSSQGE